MNSQIKERIVIAEKFKSIYNWKGKTPEKKEKMLKRLAFLDHGVVLVLLSLLIVISALSTFQVEFISATWTNAGLLVLMTMALSLRAPFLYIELLLHTHINHIQDLDTKFDKKLNTEFDSIVKRFNQRKKQFYLIGIPSLFIFISALLHVFIVNPYWEKFPPLVLIVSIYLLVRINYDIWIVKKNIASVLNAEN